MLLFWFGAVHRLFRSLGDLLFVNLVLRQQLAVLKRRRPRPTLSIFGELFWIAVSRFWRRWKQALIMVTPEAVIRWHRAGFSYIGDGSRKSLDQAGFKDVSVSQDRDKGIVTLSGVFCSTRRLDIH